MEKAMAPHSSTLAWKIPWMGEPGRLQSMGSLSVGHDWMTSLSLFTFMHWRRKWQPTPVFLPGESQGWGSLLGCHLGVAQSWTRLKRLSSSSRHLPYYLHCLTTTLHSRWHSPLLICKEAKVTKGEMTCLRSHSYRGADQKKKLGVSVPGPQ